MRDESEHEEFHADLHSALDAVAATLVIGASPTADVMRDGAVRRRQRRLAVTSGVAALAVLPVAAMAVFAGGGTGGGTKSPALNAASSPAPTGRGTWPAPKPIVVPAPLPAPGQVNPDLPNDSIVVLASGTADGKHWRLVRDRYVVAGPEPANVMGDPSSRPHLPYAANWDKPGTIECDFTGIQWGDGVAGGRDDLAGGGCSPVDDGSITRILGRFAGGGSSGSPDSPAYVWGRVDGTDVAYMSLSIDDWNSGMEPVIQVPGEKNDYYVVMVPPHTLDHYKRLSTTVYDAHGMVLGTEDQPAPPTTRSYPSPSTSTSANAKN